MDYQSVIDKYYPSESELRRILLTHSRQVADRCLRIAKAHPELKLDKTFLEEAAMLHDIGILKCDAPSIQCFGTEPYIRHGVIGGEMLRADGIDERYARVCERHTGTGLKGYEPETVEEKVVCYADKFYSKTRLGEERTVLETVKSLEKFGQEGVKRFFTWVDMFE